MEIRQLQSFVAVVEAGSFSIAATLCHITQSAISLHIKALERELGDTLMIRTSHTLQLTESGASLYEHAKKILKEESAAREDISALNGCLTGELRIGVGSFIEPYIRRTAVIMMKRYPGVRLNVEFSKAKRLNRLLREHKLDLAFTMNDAYTDEGIETMPCIPFRIYAIMNKNHPLAEKNIITEDDISQHQVILPDAGDRVYATIQNQTGIDISRFKVSAVVNSALAILSVLDDLELITFMPLQYAEGRQDLVAIPIEHLERDMMSHAHWMKDVTLKTAARTFLDIMKNEVISQIHNS